MSEIEEIERNVAKRMEAYDQGFRSGVKYVVVTAIGFVGIVALMISLAWVTRQ